MSKQRPSLRRKHKTSNRDDETDDNAFEELRSPVRKRDTRQTNTVLSPLFRSPVEAISKSAKLCPPSLSSEETPEDEGLEILSQEPTPSKWSSLLPDFNSQSDEAVGEVLWDCSSPDAVKHLKRLQKGDKTLKEIMKYFKPSKERSARSPPLQLQLLRASLQKRAQKPQKSLDTDKRKQRRLAEKHKKAQEMREKERRLFGQILSSVESEQDAEKQEAENQQETTTELAMETGVSTVGQADNDLEEEDDWEDDDLFENNSAIIAVTQDPYRFLRPVMSQTSTPNHTAAQLITKSEKKAVPGWTEPEGAAGVVTQTVELCNTQGNTNPSTSGIISDSQNSCVIPPTIVPGDSKLINIPQDSVASLPPSRKRNMIAPRNLIGSFVHTGDVMSKVDELSAVEVSKTCSDVQKKKNGLVNQVVSHTNFQHPYPNSTRPKCQTSVANSGALPQPVSRSGLTCKNLVSSIQPRGMQSSAILRQKNKLKKADRPISAFSVPATAGKHDRGSSKKVDDLLDDGLSDEMLLQLTEQDREFDSQVIQEFPTQAPPKLSAPVTLISTKPARDEFMDFVDLDPDILNSIGEFDSFSESPKCVEKHIRPKVNPSVNLRKNSSSTVSKKSVSGGESHVAPACPSIIVKHGIPVDKQPKRTDLSTAAASINFPHCSKTSAESNKGLVYPPFAQNQQQNPSPLNCLAVGNVVMEGPAKIGKYVFKSRTAVNNDRSESLVSSRAACPSGNLRSAACGRSAESSRAKTGPNDAEDMIEDDPLYESQIMAILDEVETQMSHSQQPASQTASSQGTGQAPLCSQDEIEKKRQAAMQRRRQARIKRK